MGKYLDLTGLSYYTDKVKQHIVDSIAAIPSVTIPVTDVTVEGTSIVNGSVAKITKATTTNLGVVKAGDFTVKHTNKKIQMYYNGTAIGDAIDTDSFTKDGMIESVEFVTVPSDGNSVTTDRPAGKYLKISWNTDSGKDVTYVNVNDLVDVYKLEVENGVSDGLVYTDIKLTGTGTVNDPWKLSVSTDYSELQTSLSQIEKNIKSTTELAEMIDSQYVESVGSTDNYIQVSSAGGKNDGDAVLLYFDETYAKTNLVNPVLNDKKYIKAGDITGYANRATSTTIPLPISANYANIALEAGPDGELTGMTTCDVGIYISNDSSDNKTTIHAKAYVPDVEYYLSSNTISIAEIDALF